VNIRALAEAIETSYGAKNLVTIDLAIQTDINGLFSVAVPGTGALIGCLVQERNTNSSDPNQNPIYTRCYQIDTANRMLRCRAWTMSPWGTVQSGAINVSALVWTA
jgi:hypothetical protein